MRITADELVNDMKLVIVENPFDGNTIDPTYIPRVKHLLTIAASVIAGYTFENPPTSEALSNDQSPQEEEKAGSQPPAGEGPGERAGEEDKADKKQRGRPRKRRCAHCGCSPD